MDATKLFEEALAEKVNRDTYPLVEDEMMEKLYAALQEISTELAKYGVAFEWGRTTFKPSKKVIFIFYGKPKPLGMVNVIYASKSIDSSRYFAIGRHQEKNEWVERLHCFISGHSYEVIGSTIEESIKKIIHSTVVKESLPVFNLYFGEDLADRYFGGYVPDRLIRRAT